MTKQLKHSRCRRPLQVEKLDERLPFDGATWSAAAGLPWFEPGSLTFSYALDGTQLGDAHSSLFGTLGQTGSPQQWKDEFKAAFGEWLKPLGTSITEVKDTGAPFGSFGPTQGDERFGDVRIGAVPLSGNVLAEAIPHSVMVQGSWAGDILLNSNLPWRDLHQVYAVALHEFGHVLGLRHSDDPLSPMFFDGINNSLTPTTADIQQLRQLYSGISVETRDHFSGSIERDANHEWHEEPHFAFDPALATALQANLATSARYSASGSVDIGKPQQFFKLMPIGEIDHVAFLNVVVSAKEQNGLIPKLSIYDEYGDPMQTKILHNGAGVIVVQAEDVEPNKIYYVAVSPAAAPLENQQGSFTFLAEYGSASLDATLVGDLRLTSAAPIAEQSFTVSTSRLIHVLINAKTPDHERNASALWGSLVNSQNEIIGSVAMRGDDSRAMPLVFLKADTYRLLIQIGKQDLSAPASMTAQVYIDEISIDVGVGVLDPTLQPATDQSGAVPPIIFVNGPVYPKPATIPLVPIYPSLPPWTSPTWRYWPVAAPVRLQHNALMPLDSSGDSVISPVDALMIINGLGRNAVAGIQSATSGFLDTNADGWLSPVDALLVINHLNIRRVVAEGEANMSPTTSNLPVGFDDWNSDFTRRENKRLGFSKR